MGLAQERKRLAAYRATLRDRMVEHGLGNADRFTRQFEDALIAMRLRAGAG